jgi:hypothetical protein
MAWTYDSTSRVLTHTGTDLEGAMCLSDCPPNMAVIVACADRADELRVRVLAAPDSKTGWEMGVKNGDKTKIAIRKVEFAVEAAVSVEAAHNIAADGQPYTLECLVQQTTLVARIVNSAGAVTQISHDIAGDDLLTFKRFGVFTAIADAVALSVQRCELVAQQSTRREILAVVCGGRLYVSMDGTSLAEVPGRVADATGTASCDSYAGKLYIVGGGLANVFDPVTMTITAWSDTNHPTYTLPGATSAGTTTAVGCVVHRGRVFLWTADGDELYYSEFDNPNNWQVGAAGVGAEGPGVDPVDDVIVGLRSMPNGSLLIGCRKSIKVRLGDPLLGAIDTPTLIHEVGLSGPNAIASISEGRGVLHSPSGLYLLPAEGGAVPLMAGVLTLDVANGGIQLANADDYIVSLARDPQRHRLVLSLTSRATTGDSRTFIYEERAGGYAPGAAGMFPQTFQANGNPTAMAVWGNKLVMGTRDGYLCVFEDGTVTDYRSSTITGRMPLSLKAQNTPSGDTIMSAPMVKVSPASGTLTFRIYAGADAESVYDSEYRRRCFTGTLTNKSAAFLCTVRGPALVAELQGTNLWEFEQAECEISYGQTFSRGGWKVKATPPLASNAPRVPAAGGSGPGSGPGGTGGTGGSGGSGPGSGSSEVGSDPASAPITPWTPIDGGSVD